MFEFKSNVTAIIPCFNDGAYILKALQSLYSQTMQPDKIIIIDDGSDKKTKDVLDSISNPLVQVVVQDNSGVSLARNKAISLAQTDYILNLDADDYLDPTFIEKALRVMQTDDEILVASSFYRVFSEGKTINVIEPVGGSLTDFLVINCCGSSYLLRKNIWEVTAGFDDKMINGYEDWEFWITILKSGGRIHILKEVLCHYRIKKTSRDQNALKNHDYDLRLYIFFKHKEIYESHLNFYVSQLLLQNSLLRNSINRVKKSKEFILGTLMLKPFRAIKNIYKK